MIVVTRARIWAPTM